MVSRLPAQHSHTDRGGKCWVNDALIERTCYVLFGSLIFSSFQIHQIQHDSQVEAILVLIVIVIIIAMLAPDQNEVVSEEGIMQHQNDLIAQIECIAFESS